MLRAVIMNVALRFGIFIARKKTDQEVRALLALLHPVKTKFELVRLGGPIDGGYLVPDDLNDIEACFSPGVDVTAIFEQDVLARGIHCYLADASVEAAPINDPRLDFEKKFLGVVDNDLYTTLDSWVRLKVPDHKDNLVLQMDIEGHEWPVLLNVSQETLCSFRIIVLELHFLPQCFDVRAFQMFEAVLTRLSAWFHVVHAHPNNYLPCFRYRDIEIPRFLEITLLRKDRALAEGFVTQFPHPLDAANVPDRADYVLPATLIGRAY